MSEDEKKETGSKENSEAEEKAEKGKEELEEEKESKEDKITDVKDEKKKKKKSKKKEEIKEEEHKQSHRQKSIEESAEEISDIQLSPKVVAVFGILFIGVLVVLGILVVPGLMKDDGKNTPRRIKTGKKTIEKKTTRIVSKASNPKVKIYTNMGDITVELFEDETPNTVANFIELCERSFYDNIYFHRIILNFMIQTGCPKARGGVTRFSGSGDVGYRFADEFSPELKFNKMYLLAMANSDPNTNGSQFFITHGKPSHLNNKHTIFGQVIVGKDVVDKIAIVPTYKTPTRNKPKDAPKKTIYIIKTEILQKRSHAYNVKKLDGR